MRKRNIIILITTSIIILTIAIILLNKNITILKKETIEIFDATYACTQSKEKFYEDETYIYFFPCVKSNSIYVKFKNGNKMLIIDALEAKKITIKELIDAGLEVYKESK